MAFLARFIVMAGIALFFFGTAASTQANDLRLTEQKIKAGLLYNFLKHTTWPAEADGSVPPILTVCIYGEDVFEDYLHPMAGRTVNQREIAIQSVISVDKVDSCHVVFVSAQAQDNWLKLQQHLETKPILTVSDSPKFAHSGGMIEFMKREQRIGAVFNLDAFQKAGLEINESLLTLTGVETLRQATETP